MGGVQKWRNGNERYTKAFAFIRSKKRNPVTGLNLLRKALG
jgi:hypothetical protein